ncbi:MAG: hypothetical protein N2109_06920 [Fimbriimonadales bacterium]|nr:hypothetical protein [Fimbriimonadales bacterium]
MGVLTVVWLLCASPRPALDAAFPSQFRRGEGTVEVTLDGGPVRKAEVAWTDAGASVWLVDAQGRKSGFGHLAAAAWRQLAGQAAETELPLQGTTEREKFEAIGAELPEAALAVIDRSAAEQLLRAGEIGFGWIVRRWDESSEWRGLGPKGPLRLELDAGGRLVRWSGLLGPGSGARYAYRPGSPASALGPPSQVARAANLPLPRFADERARAIVERAVQAYAKLPSTRYVSQGRDRVEVLQEGVRFRYRSGRRTVGYDGTTLWVRDGNGPTHFATADPRTAALWLDRVGVQLEPVLRELARGRNPMRLLLPPEGLARWAGTEGKGPSAVQLIEVVTPELRLVFGVRPDGLLDSMGAANVDSAGRVLNRSQRTYRYGGARPTMRDFQPPAGAPRRPLSELIRPIRR